MCVSDEILNEYQEIIERVANSFVAQNIVEAIVNSPCCRLYTPHFHFGLIRQDYDDNKFVDCAIQAGADFIVSEDSHFNVLKECDFPKVVVIGLDEFVAEFIKPSATKSNYISNEFYNLCSDEEIKLRQQERKRKFPYMNH